MSNFVCIYNLTPELVCLTEKSIVGSATEKKKTGKECKKKTDPRIFVTKNLLLDPPLIKTRREQRGKHAKTIRSNDICRENLS